MPITLTFVLSAAGWAFGAQRLLQRFMALEREDKVAQSRNISIVWLVAVYGLALAVVPREVVDRRGASLLVLV